MKTEILKGHVRHWLMTGLLLVLIQVLIGNAESAKLNGLGLASRAGFTIST
jgi:hypothetical protein